MKILRNILIGFGIIFVLIIALFGFLYSESRDFFEENKPFVEEFSYDLADDWKIGEVHSRVSNEFLQALDTPNGKAFIEQARQLGKLVEATDFQMGNYNIGTNQTTGIITFKATFQNAKGLVTVTLIKRDGKVLVQGFNISAPDGVSLPGNQRFEA